MQNDLRMIEEGEIITASRFRMWWLSVVRGYQIHTVVDMPQKTLLGNVRLVRHWSLRIPALTG